MVTFFSNITNKFKSDWKLGKNDEHVVAPRCMDCAPHIFPGFKILRGRPSTIFSPYISNFIDNPKTLKN